MEISKIISSCSFFIALLSINSVNKTGYVQKELKKALEFLDCQPPGKVYLIPVRLDDVEPRHEEITKLHYVDMFSSWDNGMQKVKQSIGLKEADKDRNSRVSPKITATRHHELSKETIERIKKNAASTHPGDFATQKYVIDKQINALGRLMNYRPQGVPLDTLFEIMENSASRHPYDFSTQLFVIEKQVESWRELHHVGCGERSEPHQSRN